MSVRDSEPEREPVVTPAREAITRNDPVFVRDEDALGRIFPRLKSDVERDPDTYFVDDAGLPSQ